VKKKKIKLLTGCKERSLTNLLSHPTGTAKVATSSAARPPSSLPFVSSFLAQPSAAQLKT